jgi:hypothetical protein
MKKVKLAHVLSDEIYDREYIGEGGAIRLI